MHRKINYPGKRETGLDRKLSPVCKTCLILLIVLVTLLCLNGCSPNTRTFSVEKETVTSFTINLVPLSDCVYYDQSTLIVYFWNGDIAYKYATIPSPYYAPNGFPYKYNPETNSLEEIDIFSQVDTEEK